MTPISTEPAVATLFEVSRLLTEAAHKIANVSGLTDAQYAELDEIDRMITRAGMRVSALTSRLD